MRMKKIFLFLILVLMGLFGYSQAALYPVVVADSLKNTDTVTYIVSPGKLGYQSFQMQLNLVLVTGSSLSGKYYITGSLTGETASYKHIDSAALAATTQYIYYKELNPAYWYYKIRVLTNSSGTTAMPKLYFIFRPYYLRQ